MRRLSLIVPAVLLVIVGFLYASFGNVRQAVLVMLNVPFALVGGVAALWLRGLNLNLSASVGFIALFGVAVLNGVVLAVVHQSAPRQRPVARGRGARGRRGAPAAGADDGAGRELRIHPDGAFDEPGIGSAAAARDGRHRRAGDVDAC